MSGWSSRSNPDTPGSNEEVKPDGNLFQQLPWLTDEKVDSGLYDCHDCGVNTVRIGHYYRLVDVVWEAACKNHPSHDEIFMLCIPCVERRLGRELDMYDFTPMPINALTAINDPLVAQRILGPDHDFTVELLKRWARSLATDMKQGKRWGT